LANQLGIQLILAKEEKIGLQQFGNQLGKNRNLAKLISQSIYARADRGCHRSFPVGVRVKQEIKK
jgi:hypothetical protein